MIAGNEAPQEVTVTKRQTVPTSQELNYTQTLTLSDHGKSWLRCDLMWGQVRLPGQNYIASVGYAPRRPRIFLNGHERNATVREKDQVNLRCESDGRPTPNISIYNNDNDTVIQRNSSPVIYTFIARCEDTATYTCFAWNEFSSQSGVNFVRLQLNVACKPRSVSSTNVFIFRVKDNREMLTFNVIAFPVPSGGGVWFADPVNNSTESSYVQSSDVNISCKSDRKFRYISKCTLTVFSDTSPSKTGMYKVQLINEHGAENFTIELS
ncbi:CD166 antigen-like [Pomacea canaliculata]|nr:CD166 antigen-like [Pomacea canaliculata]